MAIFPYVSGFSQTPALLVLHIKIYVCEDSDIFTFTFSDRFADPFKIHQNRSIGRTTGVVYDGGVGFTLHLKVPEIQAFKVFLRGKPDPFNHYQNQQGVTVCDADHYESTMKPVSYIRSSGIVTLTHSGAV